MAENRVPPTLPAIVFGELAEGGRWAVQVCIPKPDGGVQWAEWPIDFPTREEAMAKAEEQAEILLKRGFPHAIYEATNEDPDIVVPGSEMVN